MVTEAEERRTAEATRATLEEMKEKQQNSEEILNDVLQVCESTATMERVTAARMLDLPVTGEGDFLPLSEKFRPFPNNSELFLLKILSA